MQKTFTGAFCITFDLHMAVACLKNADHSSFEWPQYTDDCRTIKV